MVRTTRMIAVALFLSIASAASFGQAPDTRFRSSDPDRAAIGRLLQTYTTAVSTKNQAAFEHILKSRDIQFRSVGESASSSGPEAGINSYPDFAKEVFDGKPFRQSFQDVRIVQDGSLANVTLRFTNIGKAVSTRGFKTLQLIKVDGDWEIASELFTLHPLAAGSRDAD